MGYSRILVTLDGSKLAEAALQHVREIAKPHAQIHLLSVLADDRITEIASLASAIAQPLNLEQVPGVQSGRDPKAVHARQDYLRQLADGLAKADFEVTTEVRPGNVVDMIVSVARDGFEIVVMASHGRTGFSKMALGSVAEGVLHKSPCPVLIIPVRTAKAE